VSWAPDYSTRAAVLEYLNDSGAESSGSFVDAWITAVSRNIDKHCGRQFGQVAAAEARTYKGTWDRFTCAYVYEIDDLIDLDDYAVTDATDAELLPLNAAAKGEPYTQIESATGPRLTVTARWGWPAVPSSVVAALHMQAARLNARRNSPFGIAGSPDDGNQIQLLSRLDPDFITTLKPYVRKWWVQ
jgi:hypothetical protein